MENFSQFGIQPILLLAQVVNFLVLLYILKRFLYKPILDMLKKREEKIREGLAAGAKGEELLAKAKEEEKGVLAKASEEASLLLEESRQRAAKMEEEFLVKAREEGEQIISHARVQIEQEQKEAERALEQKSVQTAINVLEKILPRLLSKQDQIRILETSEKVLRKALPS